MDEDPVLMRALRDFNLPKIITDDKSIFLTLIRDLFPGIDPEPKVNLDLKDKVSRVTKEAKLQPPQSVESLMIDWKQTSRLITAIDREKGIYENPLLIADEVFLCMNDLKKEFQLDLQLVYLRKVHAFCYYCLEEYEDERMLAAKCAPAHIRTRFDPCAIRQISQDEAIESRLHKKTISFKYEKEVNTT